MDNIDWIYDINTHSAILRLFLALLFGGIIGLERGANKHQAGLRTHILVCIGAALAMITNLYIHQYISAASDPGRLGAQVISGIGFLGVGLILVTAKNKVIGLTTAAGLWASATIGLALGTGFYSVATAATFFVFISLALLPQLEGYFYRHSRVMNLFIIVSTLDNVKDFLYLVRNNDFLIIETGIDKAESASIGDYSINLTIKIPKETTHLETINLLTSLEGVLLIEEID